MVKIHLKVIADHGVNGTVTPLSILWTDDNRYAIDNVLDARPVASLKSGGTGMRYTVKIDGNQVYLFCDEDRWYIEQ